MTQRFDHTRAKTARARRLRREMTRPEQKLWFHLRGAQMSGFAFRRQHPVGPYVLDFYSPSVKIAIELDGDQHGTDLGLARDAARTRFLAQRGIRVLRFGNHLLKENLNGVLDDIVRTLSTTRQAPPFGLRRGDIPLSGVETTEH